MAATTFGLGVVLMELGLQTVHVNNSNLKGH